MFSYDEDGEEEQGRERCEWSAIVFITLNDCRLFSAVQLAVVNTFLLGNVIVARMQLTASVLD